MRWEVDCVSAGVEVLGVLVIGPMPALDARVVDHRIRRCCVAYTWRCDGRNARLHDPRPLGSGACRREATAVGHQHALGPPRPDASIAPILVEKLRSRIGKEILIRHRTVSYNNRAK